MFHEKSSMVILDCIFVFRSNFVGFWQVTSYAHGSAELLGIQIDAAINPGKCSFLISFAR